MSKSWSGAMTLPRNFNDLAYKLMDEKIALLFSEMAGFCESPIEAAFATAFMLLAESNYGQTGFIEPGYEKELLPPDFEFVLAAQRHIGNYRVDFLAGWNPLYERKPIVVECDGHNFHERTKEQAARDRARDRELQSSGYKVFRFTGAEIHKDAFVCATEVLEELLKLAHT